MQSQVHSLLWAAPLLCCRAPPPAPSLWRFRPAQLPTQPIFPPRSAVETCRKLKSLTSMGFSSELAAGALVSCGGDVEAAASTLLDTAS